MTRQLDVDRAIDLSREIADRWAALQAVRYVCAEVDVSVAVWVDQAMACVRSAHEVLAGRIGRELLSQACVGDRTDICGLVGHSWGPVYDAPVTKGEGEARTPAGTIPARRCERCDVLQVV